MEAVPKIPLISFELKGSPEGTSFGPKLKQYIAEAYREDADSYNNEIHQLEGLRSAAVRPSSDSAGLSALIRYFCQLRALQSRFPMAKGQPVACSFSWKDLYSNMSCSQADVHVELASILYNIGALCTQLGASEPRTSPDSMKAACTNYQHAAWAFQVVREQYPQPLGVDVSTEIMRLLQEICFAQAQECILEKSIQDTRKPSVVGAVATQVLHMYKNSIALLGTSTGSDNIYEIIGAKLYNYWYRYLSFKSSYIGCIVCLYQGMNAEEQQKMGERVAFYQQAADKLGDARKLAKYIEPTQITQEAMTFTNDVVEGKRKAAKNENEFIYHEEVPDKDLLMDLKPVCLVKALPINLNDPEVSGPDLFSRLVPMVAHEASSMYSEEKAKLLRLVVSQVEVKNTELMEFMSSLQLDQLDVLDSDQKIPQEIVDRCAAMNAKSDIIQILVDSMNNLAEIISDVEHSLSEIKDFIQEETTKEKEYQKIMGPRPPSIVQTELSREYHKYLEAHNRTNESNQVLHKAMTLHIANLKLLAQPLDVLQTKIPSIENIEGLDRETMVELRRVVSKAREMQTQRDSLLQQLREAVTNDDITSQLLARDSEPMEDIFKQELEKHTPTVKIIEQNLAAQENIINKLTSLYASYGESRRLLTDVLRKRDALINALMTSYDTHEELLGKSQKGLEFYKKLLQNVSQLLSRLRSTCQVQGEERAQLLAKQTSKAPTPVPATSRNSEVVTPSSTNEKAGLKLKDYLPYMKNRNVPRSVTPQGQTEYVSSDTYYPESIYPTSVRPAPVGSEATDVAQMQLPDGVVTPSIQTHNPHNPHNSHNPYSVYSTPYAPSEIDSYENPSKGLDKPGDINYAYPSSYPAPQYTSQMTNPQIYTNLYYSPPLDNTTLPVDPQNSLSYMSNVSQVNMNLNTNQYSVYNDPYGTVNPTPAESYPDQATYLSGYNAGPQTELNVNLAQMQISVPKSENYVPTTTYGQDYSQNYYNVGHPQTSTSNVQYPQASTPSMLNYNTGNPSNNNLLTSQTPSDYNSMYGPEISQYSQIDSNVSNAYSIPDTPQYSYAVTNAYGSLSQEYVTYTSADSTISYSTSSVTTMPPMSSALPYTSFEPDKIDPIALAQLEALDKPIISHVTGDALSSTMNYPNYQSYDATAVNYSNPMDQTPQVIQNSEDQTISGYSQSYQNHPGFSYNTGTGNYDYNYGSQNSYTSYVDTQVNAEHLAPKDNAWSAQGVYTRAGVCETMQSPSEIPQGNPQETLDQQSSQQQYYNSPYGYQTNLIQSNEIMTESQVVSTNYGANMNQSTYMQSGQGKDTSVTYSSNNQVSVSTPAENAPLEHSPPPEQVPTKTRNDNDNVTSETQQIDKEVPVESKPEPKSEPTTFDLLSDIDFTVEHKPLLPEIKVPQVSESAIKKPVLSPKTEPPPKPVIKEEVIERPAKRDIFSDPSLLNKFTQEVKDLQRLVDSLTNKTPSGLTVLDSKWKTFQEVQAKENMIRSRTIATKHTQGSIVTQVVPYDDSRLTLKSDPDVYINASYYKQLASWCIPLVIAKNPEEHEYTMFWRAMLENKINCIVCLLSEIEMQGKVYWPTAIGQTLELTDGVKVTLNEVSCTVHWTERKLTVTCGKVTQRFSHYQISVYPVKMVCSPLVLLVDKVLGQTFEGRLSNQVCSACVQCGAGAGRSAVLSLLIMTMCQVRAGQLALTDNLDAGCATLCRHRSNVLEDTRYVADAYRSALFYVQGVLCSGTTMFNGEAVSVPTGASVLPPVPTPANPAVTPSASKPQKFSRESFEEMKQSPGLKSGDMKDPLNFLDPLWSLKKK